MDQEIIKIFTQETNQLINNLEQTINKLVANTPNSDLISQIQYYAHTLKGNSAQFGFAELSEDFKKIEYLAKDLKTQNQIIKPETIETLTNYLRKGKANAKSSNFNY